MAVMMHIFKFVLKHADKYFKVQTHLVVWAQMLCQCVQTQPMDFGTPAGVPMARRELELCTPQEGILRSHLIQPLPEDELCFKHCQCMKSDLTFILKLQ